MLINVQFDEAAELIYEMLAAMGEDCRERFAERASLIASALQHPDAGSDAHVFCSLSRNFADQVAVSSGGVVVPLERTKVGDAV